MKIEKGALWKAVEDEMNGVTHLSGAIAPVSTNQTPKSPTKKSVLPRTFEIVFTGNRAMHSLPPGDRE
jgi:hypothetical protein